jgi:hypothetical protein
MSIQVCLFVNDVNDVIVVKQTMNCLKRRGGKPRQPAIHSVHDSFPVLELAEQLLCYAYGYDSSDVL